MPNITEELQELKKASQAQTSASQQLADEVSQKMGAIDKKTNDAVTNVWKEHQKFKDSVQNIIPTPLNLFKNSLMRAVESDGRPVGFSSTGSVVIEAVHPFTKGFEGPYVKDKPANAAQTVDAATDETPFWFGRYNKGDRNKRGGLADGWGGIKDGHILKITSTPKQESKSIRLGVDTLGHFSRVRVRLWVKVVTGTFYMGQDAGYFSTTSNKQAHRNPITKADTDAGTDGWLYVDKVINMSEVSTVRGNTFCFGVNNEQECEVYIAKPHLSLPMYPEAMLTAAGETAKEPVFTPCDFPEHTTVG